MKERESDLFTPSLSEWRPIATERPPWRLNSQYWLSFLAGPAAVTAIAVLNARRLQLSAKVQQRMALGGALVLLLEFAIAWMAIVGKDAEALAAGRRLLASSGPDAFKHALLGLLLVQLERESEGGDHLKQAGEFANTVGIDQEDVAVATHWLMRPYRLIERVGRVATPAILIALAILLLALNLVTAALAVAAIVWIGFLFSYTAAPLVRRLRRAFAGRRRSESDDRT